MTIVKDIFDGLQKLMMTPANFFVTVEQQAGTKAIISIMLVGGYVVGILVGIDIPAEFSNLALVSATAYITYSATAHDPKK